MANTILLICAGANAQYLLYLDSIETGQRSEFPQSTNVNKELLVKKHFTFNWGSYKGTATQEVKICLATYALMNIFEFI